MLNDDEGQRRVYDGVGDPVVTRVEIHDLESQMELRFEGIQQSLDLTTQQFLVM